MTKQVLPPSSDIWIANSGDSWLLELFRLGKSLRFQRSGLCIRKVMHWCCLSVSVCFNMFQYVSICFNSVNCAARKIRWHRLQLFSSRRLSMLDVLDCKLEVLFVQGCPRHICKAVQSNIIIKLLLILWYMMTFGATIVYKYDICLSFKLWLCQNFRLDHAETKMGQAIAVACASDSVRLLPRRLRLDKVISFLWKPDAVWNKQHDFSIYHIALHDSFHWSIFSLWKMFLLVIRDALAVKWFAFQVGRHIEMGSWKPGPLLEVMKW